jgi:predicted permease
MKKTIPLVITFLAGFYMILAFFIPHQVIASSAQEMQSWEIIIVAFTLVLGIGNLVQVHAGKIHHRKEGWRYSIVLLVCLAGMMVVGLVGGINEGTAYYWLYDNVMAPLSAAMFSLLAFFIASAAYRAFRARNREATLLLVAATIIMIGRIPLGNLIWQHLPWMGAKYPHALESLTQWIMDIPNAAGQRGIKIGAALGAVSMALRMLLGIERSYLTTGGGD